MPHDPLFEQRIATALAAHGASAEPKRMFGGVAFLVNGHMSLGITNRNELMARFDADRHEEILEWPGAKPMTYGHKNMKGFVFVEAAAVDSSTELDRWVKLSLAYVGTLPPKKPGTKTPKPAKPRAR